MVIVIIPRRAALAAAQPLGQPDPSRPGTLARSAVHGTFFPAAPRRTASAGRSARTFGFMITVRTDRCVLEPQVEAHAPAMFDVLSDPAIYEFEGVPPPSVERLAAGYRRRESRVSPDGNEQWLNWVVRLPSSELAGYVQATVLTTGVSYVAYEFASKYWRQGIGSSSVSAMLHELAQTYGVLMFVAVLKAANFRSMGLLRHLGFAPGDPSDAERYEAEQDEVVMVMAAPSKPSRLPAAANAA
jgi:ribosomal-protein-alanine N-acetyltransferase